MIEEILIHNNLEIYIPTKITKYCVISGHLFLILSILYLFKKVYFFSLLLFLLYITTIIHWKCLYVKSLYRIIDRVVVILTILYSYIFVFNYDIKYLITCLFCGIVFYFNELIHYYEVELPKQKIIYYKNVPEIGPIMKKYPKKWNFSKFNNNINMSFLTFYIINFFNIKPTYNNTKKRIYAYHKNVLIHAIFVHFVFFTFHIYKNNFFFNL